MPKNLSVDCVIVDEIQLAADYERGHIFTDRILNSRGNFQTIFLGSLNIENILKKFFQILLLKRKIDFLNLLFLENKIFQNLSQGLQLLHSILTKFMKLLKISELTKVEPQLF